MKYVKMLALAAVAAGALMAFIGAGTASASVLCSTTTEAGKCPEAQIWPNKTVIDFSLTPETSALLKETGAEGKTLDTCKVSTVKGELTNAAVATGKITELTWGTCTFPTKTVLNGGLQVDRIAGTSNGTVTSDGITEVTINTILFGSCIYTVESGKSIGTLTEGKPAVFTANASAIKTAGAAAACPETSVWTASYTLTSPTNTTLSVS